MLIQQVLLNLDPKCWQTLRRWLQETARVCWASRHRKRPSKGKIVVTMEDAGTGCLSRADGSKYSA